MVKAMIMCIMEKRGSKGIHTGNDLLVNIKEEGSHCAPSSTGSFS